MAPKNNTKGGKGGKGPSTPTSAFGTGKFKRSPEFLKGVKKDNRHKLVMQGLQKGVIVGYMTKFKNKEEEPFGGPYFKMLQDNPDLMEQLGIDAILFQKGVDGDTAMPQNPACWINTKSNT